MITQIYVECERTTGSDPFSFVVPVVLMNNESVQKLSQENISREFQQEKRRVGQAALKAKSSEQVQ
jgi:hypothetical protein